MNIKGMLLFKLLKNNYSRQKVTNPWEIGYNDSVDYAMICIQIDNQIMAREYIDLCAWFNIFSSFTF